MPFTSPQALFPLSTEQLLADPSLPRWVGPVQREFRRHILDPSYPCLFATIAEKKGELRYAIADSPEDPHLPRIVATFFASSAESPSARLALAILFEPKSVIASHDDYRAELWRTLQHLHRNDAAAWPTEQPSDPNDPRWEFCFAGTPAFVFGAAPTYHRRRSRNLGPSLLLLIQPRRVFHGIEGGTSAGETARRKIRARLHEWDLVGPHPDFGNFGDPSSREWQQYFVNDDNTPLAEPCPFVFEKQRRVRVTSTSDEYLDHLPIGRSLQIRRDAPNEHHEPHTHSIAERLTLWRGELTFRAQGETWVARPGDQISLPIGVVHESVAGPTGAIYTITAA